MVSCLMITQPSRKHFAAQAAGYFAAQTYEDRELVVIKHEDPSATLGQMRNMSLRVATGDMVATWDDDDIHAPERLAVQIRHMKVAQADACFLMRVTMECICGYRILTMPREFWEQTMVAKRSALFGTRYKSLAKGEDTLFVETAVDKGLHFVTIDAPHLYVYRFHGGNAWNAEHFDTHFAFVGDSHRPSECLKSRISEGVAQAAE